MFLRCTYCFVFYSNTRYSVKFNGAQQKLSELLTREIPYTKCIPHGVNLVVEHGCAASAIIGKVFGVLEQIFVFFTGSTKRHEELSEKSWEVENFLQLRNLSKTRWTARPESVEAVWRGLNAIILALEELRETGDKDGKSKAANLINAIVNVDFVCGVMVLKNIMYKTKLLADFLQKETVDIAGALTAIESTLDSLSRIRNAEKEINDEIEAALQVARNLGADPIADFTRLHRIRKPPKRVDDRPESTANELNNIHTFYRTEIFKFLDQLCTTLTEKRNSLRNTFSPFLAALNPLMPGTIKDTQRLITKFPDLFSQESSGAVHGELAVFFDYARKVHEEEQSQQQSKGVEVKPLTCTTAANIALNVSKNHGLHKSVAKLYKLFLTAAPSVCKNERSFSLMKIVKSYIRNKISGERLNDCMILAAEKDITSAINVHKLAKKWACLKNRRVPL